MSSNNELIHALCEKIRQLQVENEDLKKRHKGVKDILNNALPTDDKFSIIHRIKLIVR